METQEPATPHDEPDGMKPVVKAGRINGIILLIYAALFFVMIFLGGNADWGEWLFAVALGVMAQGGINLILGILFFIGKKPGFGKASLLYGLVMLVIGFSACVGAVSTMSFH